MIYIQKNNYSLLLLNKFNFHIYFFQSEMMFLPNQYYYTYNTVTAVPVIPTTTTLSSESSQRTRFTKEEDERLKQLVSCQDSPNWNEISRYMTNRTARQCRERYNNYLRPTLTNGPWTKEENELLIALYEKYGPKWSLISQSFNGRSSVNVKNHHSSLSSQLILKNRSSSAIKSDKQPDKAKDTHTQAPPKKDDLSINNANTKKIIDKNKKAKKETVDHLFENMFSNFQNILMLVQKILSI